VKLVANSSQPIRILCNICAIFTVYAVGPEHPPLCNLGDLVEWFSSVKIYMIWGKWREHKKIIKKVEIKWIHL
jgi:hypothetical protein